MGPGNGTLVIPKGTFGNGTGPADHSERNNTISGVPRPFPGNGTEHNGTIGGPRPGIPANATGPVKPGPAKKEKRHRRMLLATPAKPAASKATRSPTPPTPPKAVRSPAPPTLPKPAPSSQPPVPPKTATPKPAAGAKLG